ATGYSLRGATSTPASTRQTQSNLRQVEQNVIDLQKSLAQAAHFGTPSVYKGLVTIRHSVSSLRTSDADKEYVSISVSSRATTGIDITGWRLASEAAGHSIRIPVGVGLPRSA